MHLSLFGVKIWQTKQKGGAEADDVAGVMSIIIVESGQCLNSLCLTWVYHFPIYL